MRRPARRRNQVIDLLALDDQIALAGRADRAGWQVAFYGTDGKTRPSRLGATWPITTWEDRVVAAGGLGEIATFDGDLQVVAAYWVQGFESGAQISALNAGDEGLVVTESRWTMRGPGDEPPRVVILRDGFRLEATSYDLQLSKDGDVVLRGSLEWDSRRDRYFVDLDAEHEVTFLAEDGSPLVSFSLAELAQLEQEISGSPGREQQYRVLYTVDGSQWFGGELGLSEGLAVVGAYIGQDRVTVTQVASPRGPWPAEVNARIDVWEAELPGPGS